MIVITAKLVREQCPVFLSGETVECFISFTNPPRPEHKISQSNSDILENLAWATCQIHCYCNFSSGNADKQNDGSLSGSTKRPQMTNSNETSLTAAVRGQGQIVFATNPRIMFCDLELAPGETKSYLFRDSLPMTAPPTYRGSHVKYSYKITVATQRLGSRVQVLRVPIRVLPMPEVVQSEEALGLCNETNEELAPTNPFLEKKKSESKLDMALHHLQNITARRRPNFYLISNKHGIVGRFCLFKPAYKLGEDIVGTLDFSCGTVSCYQYSITLRCEELIYSDRTEEDGSRAVAKTKAVLFNKHHEVCLGLLQTQMILPVPLHVTPTFKTDRTEIRWQLHFQFVTNAHGPSVIPKPDDTVWHAPKEVEIETMIWTLPITLYATCPQLIQQNSNKYKLIIK